jgi:hypothetical protein
VQFASSDDERTLVSERPQLQATMGGAAATAQDGMSADVLDSALHDTVEATPKSAAANPATSSAPATLTPASRATQSIAPLAAAPRAPRRSAFKSLLRAITFLLLLGIVGAAAFYGGMYYQKQILDAAQLTTTPVTEPTPPPAPQPSTFEQGRARVDKDPKEWIDKVALPRANQENKQPLDVDDPEFLYLYGRALFLNRDYNQSLKSFNNALAKLDQKASTEAVPLKTEVLLGKLAAAQKIQDYIETRNALNALEAISVKKDALPSTPAGPVKQR